METLKNEMHRLAVILTELDFNAWLNSSFPMSSSEMNNADSLFNDSVGLNQSYEFYMDFFAKEYMPYADCDDLGNWITNNIRNIVEAGNKEVFQTYGSISCLIGFKKESGRYWSSIYKMRKEFGKYLEKTRKINRKNQSSLGLTKSQISLIENAEANPSLDNLLVISRALGLKLKFE